MIGNDTIFTYNHLLYWIKRTCHMHCRWANLRMIPLYYSHPCAMRMLLLQIYLLVTIHSPQHYFWYLQGRRDLFLCLGRLDDQRFAVYDWSKTPMEYYSDRKFVVLVIGLGFPMQTRLGFLTLISVFVWQLTV